MTVMERLANSIVVPVVVLNKVEDAVPTARAMAAGGVDTMEITFRTACAPEAIKAVADNCPEVLVGAGTIVNVEQAKLAVEMGAKFIVSPGFSDEVVAWCVENDIPIAPGCVTPTEIMAALKHGLKMVKFFPANVYGGLNAMKNLSAPFVGLKFLPTGGVNTANIKEYIDAPFIHAVGGSWVCPAAAIANGEWDKITALCLEARAAAKGE
ncbi:MAG: bifunctional 4-hydroxy-2-oxoglutarate aldolase/2-dehydro-3-deoxy-phosphogluconate aldolase [Clostridia bacterium]|nr:bifunctional 4-hydroxy-2-oxoglutarate aldolase/2-dehydro-3-deoxy-phosphogluconate aldolase [Clostridia bacterium]